MSRRHDGQTARIKRQKDNAEAAFLAATTNIIKHGKGFEPEWARSKPGEHPALPLHPPGRR